MDSGDELNNVVHSERRRRHNRVHVVDGLGLPVDSSHRSQSSRSPSDASLLHDSHHGASSLVRVYRTTDQLSRPVQVQAAYMTDLQRCVREATSCVTRFINAFDEARSRRRCDDPEGRRGRVVRLWRRASDDCTIVADRSMPPLVEAIRATITQPTSVRAFMQLVNASLDAVRPSVRMLLSVRQLLNEADDDVTTISRLTSLVLAVAESLQRMRRATERALAAYAAEVRPRDTLMDGGGRGQTVTSSDVQERALVPYGGKVDTGHYDDDDYRLTLVALESCDAAYRQIQGSGACLDQMTSSQSVYWRPTNITFDDDDLQVRLLNKVIQLCYALGTSVTAISKSAKDGYVDDFCESVRNFAAAVSRIVIILPQMAEGGDVVRTRNLCLSGRAIRHCASSLVTSARQIASQRQHWSSYRAYAQHSRALSRALTHLVRYLSADYDYDNYRRPIAAAANVR